MGLNYTRMQKIVDRQIKNFGGGADNATLKRGSVSRSCSIVILQFTNQERVGNLLQWTDQRVLVSAKDLTTPPDNELDTLVHLGVEYRIVQPPTALAPDGETVLYWELVVRK